MKINEFYRPIMNENGELDVEPIAEPKTRIILYIDSFRLEFESAKVAADFIKAYTDNFSKEPSTYGNQSI